jgi:predicted transcriptional regulator
MTLQCPNITRKANERSVMDIARDELVERKLTRMIERRSRQKDPDEESELWRESVERYNVLLASRRRAEWCEFHKEQAARLRSVLEAAVARHEEAAAALENS